MDVLVDKMLKQGTDTFRKKIWKTRYCRFYLQSNEFQYGNSEGNYDKSIHLSTIKDVRVKSGLRTKSDHGFILETNKMVHRFICANDDVAHKWVSAIKNRLQEVHYALETGNSAKILGTKSVNFASAPENPVIKLHAFEKASEDVLEQLKAQPKDSLPSASVTNESDEENNETEPISEYQSDEEQEKDASLDSTSSATTLSSSAEPSKHTSTPQEPVDEEFEKKRATRYARRAVNTIYDPTSSKEEVDLANNRKSLRTMPLTATTSATTSTTVNTNLQTNPSTASDVDSSEGSDSERALNSSKRASLALTKIQSSFRTKPPAKKGILKNLISFKSMGPDTSDFKSLALEQAKLQSHYTSSDDSLTSLTTDSDVSSIRSIQSYKNREIDQGPLNATAAASSIPGVATQRDLIDELYDIDNDEEELRLQILLEKEKQKTIDLSNETTLKELGIRTEEYKQQILQAETKKAQKEQTMREKGMALQPKDLCGADRYLAEVLKRDSEKRVLFSDLVSIEVKKNEVIPTILVVATKSIYFLDPKTKTLSSVYRKRDYKIPFKLIDKVLQNGYDHSVISIIISKSGVDIDDIIIHTEVPDIRGVYENPASSKRSFNLYQKKIDLFDYLSSAFYTQYRKRIPIWFVEDVLSVSRRPGERPLEREDKVEPVKLMARDFCQITGLDTCGFSKCFNLLKIISFYGDMEVLLACHVTKKNKKTQKVDKRYFVITDNAIYLFAKDKEKRRVDLENVGRVIKNRKTHEVLIQCPTEYDILFKPTPEDAQHIIDAMKSLFEDTDLVHEEDTPLKEVGITQKTLAYKRLLQNEESEEFLSEQLRNSIKNDNPKQMKYYITKAWQLSNSKNTDLLRVQAGIGTQVSLMSAELKALMTTAQNRIKKIQSQEFIREKLEQAIQNKNFKLINDILDYLKEYEKGSPLYVPLKQFYNKNRGNINRILGEKILLYRLEQMVTSDTDREEQTLLEAFDLAARAGLSQHLTHYRSLYDRTIQIQYIKKLLDDAVNNNDGDLLLLLLMNAEALKSNNVQFKKAKERLDDFITKNDARHNIAKAMNEAREKMNPKPIQEMKRLFLKEGTDKLKTDFKWLEGDSVYQAAEQEIKKIKNRVKNCSDLHSKTKDLRDALQDTTASFEKVRLLKEDLESIKRDIESDEYISKEKVRTDLEDASHVLAEAHSRMQSIYSTNAQQLDRQLRHALNAFETGDSTGLDTILELQELVHRAISLSPSKTSTTSTKQAPIVLDMDQVEKIHPVLKKSAGEAIRIILEYKTLDRYIQPTMKIGDLLKDFENVKLVVERAKRNNYFKDILDKFMPIYERLSKMFEAKQQLDRVLEQEDIDVMKKAMEKVIGFEELREDIIKAQQILSKKEKDKKDLQKSLQEAITSNHVKLLMTLVEKAKPHKDLQNLISKAKIMIAADKKDIETLREQLDKLMQSENVDELKSFISRNEAILPEELRKKAKADLNKKQQYKSVTSEDAKETLQWLLGYPVPFKSNSKPAKPTMKELQIAVEDARRFISQDDSLRVLIHEAEDRMLQMQRKENLKSITDMEKELIRYESDDEMQEEMIRNFDSSNLTAEDLFSLSNKASTMLENREFKKKTPSKTILSTHALIEKLHTSIMKLRSHCAIHLQETQPFVVPMNDPVGLSVVRALVQVLDDKIRKKYFVWERHPVDVLSTIPNRTNTMQRALDDFAVLDIVKKANSQIKELPHLSQEKSPLSLLLVHYLLSVNMFQQFIQELFKRDQHVKDCYDTSSVMRNVSYRVDLSSTLELLSQFSFRFSGDSNVDTLIAHPLSKVKGAVRAIVQYFVNHKDMGKEWNRLGDDSFKEDVGILVREKLCDSLLSILLHNFKTSTNVVTKLFGSNAFKVHIWQIIEEVANGKRITAVDLGGVTLPITVDTINSYYNPQANSNLKRLDSTYLLDLKFQAFVCVALNERALSDYLESIVKEREILKKYYLNENALIFDEETTSKMISFAKQLSKLPFKLRIIWLDSLLGGTVEELLQI